MYTDYYKKGKCISCFFKDFNYLYIVCFILIRSLVGCSFCQVIGTNVSYCFTHLGPGFNPCVSTNGTSRTNNGVSCNSNWISSRSCEQYTTCTDCLATWPNNYYENSNVSNKL